MHAHRNTSHPKQTLKLKTKQNYVIFSQLDVSLLWKLCLKNSCYHCGNFFSCICSFQDYVVCPFILTDDFAMNNFPGVIRHLSNLLDFLGIIRHLSNSLLFFQSYFRFADYSFFCPFLLIFLYRYIWFILFWGDLLNFLFISFEQNSLYSDSTF
jgi:hypothetical protein